MQTASRVYGNTCFKHFRERKNWGQNAVGGEVKYQSVIALKDLLIVCGFCKSCL